MTCTNQFLPRSLAVLCLSWTASLVKLSDGFVPHARRRHSRTTPPPLAVPPLPLTVRLHNSGGQDDNENEPIFYDDFAEAPNESASFFGSNDQDTETPQNLSSLSARVEQVQAADKAESARIRTNWEQANWEVRGFSLDPSDRKLQQDYTPAGTANADVPPIRVSALVQACDPSDETEQMVWVGRSDGSLLLVRLGSDFQTYFSSSLTLESTADQDAATIESKLTREGLENEESSVTQDPCDILCQMKAYQGQGIAHIVTTAHNIVYTVAQDDTHIQPWLIPESTTTSTNDDDDTFALIAQPTLQELHRAPIVGLHSVSLTESEAAPTLLTSVSTDGTLGVWDIPGGHLLFTCQFDILTQDISTEETFSQYSITSSAASHGYWILGCVNGNVLVYRIDQLVQSTADGGGGPCPLPACEWQANPRGSPITAVHCVGSGTLRGSTPALIVVSGDADGVVKQWTLLERPDTGGLEAWPKMARQRMPERAHLLEGHEGTITCITSTNDKDFIVTAGVDGTVRAWDPSSGIATTRMDGFDENGPYQSLCLIGPDLLLTGNGRDVAVHDFSADDDILNDVELDWDP